MAASSLTLPPLSASDVMEDVYFREDFIQMHARSGFDLLATPAFRIGAALVPIPGTDRHDLETAWGYGGPVAHDIDALDEGLAAWRRRQREAGRVAEFIRLHPFLNPEPLRNRLDMLNFNRATVVVDLAQGHDARWKFYSDSTRNCIRKAARTLRPRELNVDDAALFKRLYESGLDRNTADLSYYLDDGYFQALLAASWCTAWVVEDADGAIAVGAFLHGDSNLCHYHLSGGDDRARRSNAHYLMLDAAFDHFGARGVQIMHLGGGRSADAEDALLKFKSKFSPMRRDFLIGGLIHDRAAYDALGGGRGRFLCAGVGAR